MIYGTEQSEDDMAKSRQASPSNGYGVEAFRNMKEFQFGAGENKILGNKEGFSIGGVSYSNAPFSVDYNGVMYATRGVITGDFTVSGFLQTGDTSSDNTIFGTNGGNSGLLFYSGSTFKGGVFHIGTTVEVQSEDDLVLSCGTSGSVTLAKGATLLGNLSNVGDFTIIGKYNSGVQSGKTGNFKDQAGNTIFVTGGIITGGI